MSYSTCILIPAYQPNEALLEVINGIYNSFNSLKSDNPEILIVNDGSTGPEANYIFSLIKQKFKKIYILELNKNHGKGDALKEGFRYIEKNLPHVNWIVTADADGQHLACDILKIVSAGLNANSPVLGVRFFDKSVPLRSRLGNNITKTFFKMLYGGNILDTQTGLRGFSSNLIPELLEIKAGNYAFETQMLIQFIKSFEVRQIKITTVYEPKNPTSHFHPIFDSLKIYWVLLRHFICASLAACIEIVIFNVLTTIEFSVEHALMIGRFFAGISLFLMARSIVFRNKSSILWQILKYTLLTILHLAITIWIVKQISHNNFINPTAALLMAYLILSLISFIIQRLIIFRHK